MPEQELRRRLADLHAELERTQAVDAESRALLREVLEDIQHLLEADAERARGHEESLIDRLREATREFEESHPTLATTVGRVLDALANMGI